MALIDAVLGDSEATASMKRLAALAKSELLSSALPTSTAAASTPPPPLSAHPLPRGDPRFNLGGEDSPSFRLPVSMARRNSVEVETEGNSNLMHPY